MWACANADQDFLAFRGVFRIVEAATRRAFAYDFFWTCTIRVPAEDEPLKVAAELAAATDLLNVAVELYVKCTHKPSNNIIAAPDPSNSDSEMARFCWAIMHAASFVTVLGTVPNIQSIYFGEDEDVADLHKGAPIIILNEIIEPE